MMKAENLDFSGAGFASASAKTLDDFAAAFELRREDEEPHCGQGEDDGRNDQKHLLAFGKTDGLDVHG